jgi:hypothetical protein
LVDVGAMNGDFIVKFSPIGSEVKKATPFSSPPFSLF